MQSLQERLQNSLNNVNERLEDDWFKCFEFRSKEDFKAFGPQSFATYVDKNDLENKLANGKYLGQPYKDIVYQRGMGAFELEVNTNHNGCWLAARGEDGRIYSNDENFLKAMGLTPAPNRKFDGNRFRDKWDGKQTVGYQLFIPGYKK
jgi:hypothetical protein